MRRRRKFKGLWLPPDPFNSLSEPPDAPVTVPSDGDVKGVFWNAPMNQGTGGGVSVALVGDFNEEVIAGASAGQGNPNPGSLADVSIGYSLRRVVGSLFIGIDQAGEIMEGTATGYFVTAGIIVRRVGQDGLPVSGDLSPDAYNAYGDPYLWRKSWMLRNNAQPPPLGFFNTSWPSSNYSYGSVADGPKVDQQTRRTIKSEERLFLDLWATAIDGAGAGPQNLQGFAAYYNLRFYGRTFTAAGNRRNASR